MDYRHKIDVTVARLPEGFEEEKRRKCGVDCCPEILVLASTTSNLSYQNDVTGVSLKKYTQPDSITFSIEDSAGNVLGANTGFSATFPNDPLASGYIFVWKDILTAHGADCYTVKANFTISGIQGSFTVGKYTLKEYSVENAKGTVRIYSSFNSYLLKNDIDYTDSDFVDSIRFNGFFGDRKPETEINNLVDKDRKIIKTNRENLNKYELRTDPIDINITRVLLDFHFLNEDSILISDHNLANHDYLIFDKPVSIPESSSIEYIYKSRLAKITATFGDRKLDSISYYQSN